MADAQNNLIPIDYTSRDYGRIKQDLLQIAERFYPDTFKDFSEGSFGALMLDAVAYIGDQLSFYLDYNVNESFLDTAYQYNNVVRHGRILGYKSPGIASTYGQVAVYAMVAASSTGLGPDKNALPILKAGSAFASTSGIRFLLLENIDFANPSNRVIAAKTSQATGAPTHYAIKAYGPVVSGYYNSQTVTVGGYQKFRSVRMNITNLAEIISVTDAQGNQYYEVENLSQDLIFREVANKNYKADNVPSILKPFLVSRKFTVERDGQGVTLQFGSGQAGATGVVADIQQKAVETFGKGYVTDTTFDPTRLSKNENYGIVPSNTALTIVYRAVDPNNNNLSTGTVTRVTKADLEYADLNLVTSAQRQDISNSLEVYNEEPILGVVNSRSSTEVKMHVYNSFSTQNRAVTQTDYENLAYRMPGKFGSILRVCVQRDPDSLKRNLNMYVISQGPKGYLTRTNTTIKNNLKTWLNHYRMINDTVDILDPYIINIGIEFVLRPQQGVDKYVLLNKAVKVLSRQYSSKMYIGEQLSISDIYATLKDVTGVLDVVSVTITNKTGLNYSNTQLDINANMSPDGAYIVTPKNAILEIKYPRQDIRGRIR